MEMERKQGFFSSLKDEIVRGLSPGKSRSHSPMTALIRRRKNHHAKVPEVIIPRSGSLRPPEALSPLREGPDQGDSDDSRPDGGWPRWMKWNPSSVSETKPQIPSPSSPIGGDKGAPRCNRRWPPSPPPSPTQSPPPSQN